MERTATFILDGIPFGVAANVFKAGFFPDFNPPVKLISTFPTLTGPAFSSIFGLGCVPSYGSLCVDEQKHFLRVSNQKANKTFFDLSINEGSFALQALTEMSRSSEYSIVRWAAQVGRQALRRTGRTWRSFLDHELAQAENLLLAARGKPHLRIVISSIDELCHREGLCAAEEALAQFATWLQNMQARVSREFLMLSDHGNAPTKAHFYDYGRALKNLGLPVCTRVNKTSPILVPLYSTVTFFPVYVYGSCIRDVAEALANMEGVELVAYREGTEKGIVYLLNAAGHSRVSLSEGVYRYYPERDDLLGYNALSNDHLLTRQSDGSLTVCDWMVATEESHFPLAPERIINGFSDFEQPAQILVSLADDNIYGLPFVHKLYRPQCMHGNIGKRASEAFALVGKEYPQQKGMPNLLRLGQLRQWVKIV